MYKEEERRRKGGVERFLMLYQLGRSRAFVVDHVTRGWWMTEAHDCTNSFIVSRYRAPYEIPSRIPLALLMST